MMLIRQRPFVMTTAIALLFISANLDALGILLMAYPFTTLPEGEGSFDLLLNNPEFRKTVGYCFGAAIILFFTGATMVVLSMQLAVSIGRQKALSIGNKLVSLIADQKTIELAMLEQSLLKHGGIEKLFRRAIRSLVRASFLLPRIISFCLTATVGLGVILWIDPAFGLFALIGLTAISLPLYIMNRGVLKKVPVMERTMRRSQVEIGKLVAEGESSKDIFDIKSDFSNSISIMGHLMTVRYRAGVIRSVFMSVCLIAVGAYLFMFESIDLGLIIPLLLALKLFAGSLQGIMRMSTGVSRTLVDSTPALVMETIETVKESKPVTFPLAVHMESGSFALQKNEPCKVVSNGVSDALAIAMTISRIVTAEQSPMNCKLFYNIQDGVEYTDSQGDKYSIVLTTCKASADLFVNRKTVAIQQAEMIQSAPPKSSDAEEELELELDLG